MSTGAGRPAWMEKPSLAASIGKAVALLVIVVLVLFPFYAIVLTSLSSRQAVQNAGGLVLVPHGLNWSAYRDALTGGVVLRSLLVSVGITTVGTLVSVTVTVLAAYGLSRPGSLWHRPLLILVLLTFLFVPGIIPSYLVMQSLGLLNTYASLIVPVVAAFHLIVMRSFFMNIPSELIDSARIDGASEFRILGSVVLPLSKAIIAVIALFYAVGYWNAFFNALLYLNDPAKWPLQLVLRTYVLQGQMLSGNAPNGDVGNYAPPALAVQTAVLVLAIIPVLFVYPFVQRHFVKGVIIGAVKG